MLLTGLPPLRRGMTAVVITASRDRRWVRALSSLRGRGVAAAVIALNGTSYDLAAAHAGGSDADLTLAGQEQRALGFALAEYDIKFREVRAGDDLGAVLT
jgi:hypothetical protein